MKYFIGFCCLLAFLAGITFAQPPSGWSRTYGGSGNDVGSGVKQTPDEGYIVVGSTDSFGAGGSDVYLIRTDEFGDTLWTRTFGGIYSDYGSSVELTDDGGFIIAGVSYYQGYDSCYMYLVKTDSAGDTLWTKQYGLYSKTNGSCAQQTTDGGYIAVGTTFISYQASDVFLVKTDANGDSLWTKALRKYNYNEGVFVRQTIDGGFIITGYTAPDSLWYQVILLVKTDTFGDTLWTQTFRTYTDCACGKCVQMTLDGGYIIAGDFGWGLGWDLQIILIKTDADGDSIWGKVYGGGGVRSYCNYVEQISDSGYILTGGYYDWVNYPCAYLMRTDATGDSLWGEFYLGNPASDAYCCQQTTDRGFVIAGSIGYYPQSDLWLIKTDESGSNVKHRPLGVVLDKCILYPIFPNPFNSQATITFSLPASNQVSLIIYDTAGREVAKLADEFLASGEHSFTFDASTLSSGIYFAYLTTKKGSQTQKMLLVK